MHQSVCDAVRTDQWYISDTGRPKDAIIEKPLDNTQLPIPRGVQYVHWVMHKCIMVKVGRKRNTHKVCKKQVNFSKTGRKFLKVGGEIIIFAKQGVHVLKQGK